GALGADLIRIHTSWSDAPRRPRVSENRGPRGVGSRCVDPNRTQRRATGGGPVAPWGAAAPRGSARLGHLERTPTFRSFGSTLRAGGLPEMTLSGHSFFRHPAMLPAIASL